MTTQVKFYCKGCEKHQPVEMGAAISNKERPQLEGLSEEPWGDIVCNVCRLVVATYSAEHEGKLEFVWQDFKQSVSPSASPLASVSPHFPYNWQYMPQDE